MGISTETERNREMMRRYWDTMKEFTITVTADRPPSNPFEDLGVPKAGPVTLKEETSEKGNHITSITLTARLVDVEYSEAQALLEQMKKDARKS
jgi:hypothetical protein